MKEGAGRREGARSKTWFVLPILFGFGGQKSPRKEFPNDLFGEKITIGGGRMGRGSQGQVAPAPVPVNTTSCRKAETENVGLAPRPAFPFLPFLDIFN